MRIDRKSVQELLELEKLGDPELIHDLVRMFLAQWDSRVGDLESRLANADVETAKRIAHSLKSSSSQLGLLRISELWKKIEEGAGDFSNLLQELHKLFPLARLELTQFAQLKEEYFSDPEFKEKPVTNQCSINILSNITHELRTPLNGILGMSNLLLETSLNPKQLDYAKHIRSCVDHMLFLVNDLMDAAKLEAGKMELETVSFDLNHVVDEIVMMIRFSLNGRKVKVEVEGNTPFPTYFRGDPGRISQVLLNLLSNAVKFSSQGTVLLRIQAAPTENGTRSFQFEVIDTGIGISEKNLEKLFKSFSQADDSHSRKYGGTGLGLWISKKIVDLLNGSITVKSELGKGSTFTVCFSLSCGEENTIGKPIEFEFPESPRNSFRILVAEDNPINQKVILNQLERLGYTVDVVGNGLEVLGALELIHYDLILMDCQMPEMDGLEATRRIRSDSDSPTQAIPIIALTAGIAKDWHEKCSSAGMNDFMEKPVTREKLKAGINKWLHLSSQQDRKKAA